jgi:hypothetical protein
VPTFGRTGSGKWHVVGPDGCQYGQAFTAETDTAPDETVTATDIVAYEPPDPPDDTHLSSIAVSSSRGGRSVPSSRSDEQRLVLPTAIRESTAGLCESCKRGERYYEEGAVTDLKHVDDLLHATVHGSRPYDVQVTLSDGRYVEGQCSCPDGAVPCKHIVAVVLASGDVEAVGSDRSIEEVLAAASAEDLRTLLGDLAADDLTLRKHIYEELDDS